MMFGFVGFHQRDSASTSTCWCGRYHRATNFQATDHTIRSQDTHVSMITIWINGTD